MDAKFRTLIITCIGLFGLMLIAGNLQAQQPLTVADIVAKLTLEEKAKLVVGAGMNIPGMPGMSTVGQTEEKVPGAAGTTQGIPRLNLPKAVMADGPAGVRISPTRKNTDKTFYATGFPVATLLASTFDTPLMERVGMAYGNEVKSYGIDFLLAPALNLHRNPLGGRNFEYYSEDPVVSGKMAAAFVRGLQSQGVGATIKHFAANNQETNRTKSNTIVSKRALRELYLKGFEIAVKESSPWAVMSSYNKINGVYASESPELLRTILRDEWGFSGFVMTDWFGGENTVQQMIAGNDLLMPGTPAQEQAIIAAVKDGKLDEKILDRNVAAILNVYYKTPTFLGQPANNAPDFENNRRMAKNAAADGMVLLKNSNNVLPLKRTEQPVALLGVGSFETIAGGTGSGDVNKAYVVTVADGFNRSGIPVASPLIEKYTRYLASEKEKLPRKNFFFEPDTVVPEMDWSSTQLDSLAGSSSAAVFTLTRTSGEFADRKEEDDFLLTNTETELIRKISKAFRTKNKPFIVLMNIGGVIETASWKEHADAILVIWQPGQEGGLAVAEILTGTINPSGKLPMTFPVAYAEVPSSKNFPGKELEPKPEGGFAIFQGVKSEVVYEEDIYVGYRYFDSFNKKVSYPFGFGLSYSSFTFGNMKVAEKGGTISVSVTVKNNGKAAGREVVQLYVSAPPGNLEKPVKELKAFGKTGLLQPGGTETIRLIVAMDDLASYDEERSAWVVEAGEYTFHAAKSVDNVAAQAKFVLRKPMTRDTNNVLAPERDIRKIKRR